MGKPLNRDQMGNAYLNLMSAFGIALAVLGLGHLILPHNGEPYEWAQYLLLGAVFSPLLYAVHFPFHHGKVLSVLEIFRRGSALAALAFCVFIIPGGDIPLVCGFALAQWYFLGGARDLALHDKEKIGASLFALVAAYAAWGLLSRFAPIGRFVTGGAQQVLTAFLAATLVIWYRPHDAVMRASRTLTVPRLLAELGLVLVLALAAFRVPSSINENQEFYVGSAALVRQGGWLLWDVPSQYGFLNILLLAALPFKSLHISLYVAASALQLICALIMYGMLRALRQDIFGAAAGLLLTITLAFMVSGGTPDHTALNTSPSTGGMRFIFCYLLLAWSYWNIAAENDAGCARDARFWAGSCLWAAGCLWSSESFIYSTSIWLPQSLWLAWETAKHRYGADNAGPWRRSPLIFLSSLLPLLILFGAVNFYYIFGLGHWPDWYAFIEYAKAYKGGFGAIPIDPRGGVWGLLLVFTAVSACAAAAFGERLKGWPALIGIMGIIWTTASYFISRSSEANILNLAPLHFTCAVAAMSAFKEKPVHRLALWAVLIPLSAVLLIATWGNPGLPRFFIETFRTDQKARVYELLPKAEEPLADILKEVGYKKGDPLVVLNFMMPPLLAGVDSKGPVDDTVPSRFWLPMAPAAELMILPLQRQKVYISRFAGRFREGGWLAVPREIPTDDVEGFFAGIDGKYRITRARNNKDWLVRRYEPR